MQTAAGTVAVVVPVYVGRYLEDCLTSIAVQTRPPDEVIVVDDGSPDGPLVRQAIAECGRTVTLLTQTNQGAAAARNRGLLAANTDYVAFLDADDYWYPTFLATMLGVLQNRPGCAAGYADAHIIGDSPLAGRRFLAARVSRGGVTVRSLLTQPCEILTSTVVARRRPLVDAGLFDAELQDGQDFDLWVRMAQHGARFACHREPLAAWRAHSRNMSGTPLADIERTLIVIEKLRRTLALSGDDALALEARLRHLRSCRLREVAKARLASADFDGARRAFESAAADGGDWSATAARMGLRLAPRLVRRLFVGRGGPRVHAAS